jgi:flagellar biosynthesis/type III secretory pathway M-ring protein FliF/YscJ
MAAGVGGATSPLQNRNVQIGIGIGLLVVILAIVILFMVNGSKSLGNYRNLVTGVDQPRALEIAAQLKSKGIESEIAADAAGTGGVTVQVREKQYDDAVMEMARSNLLLTDDFKLFDKTDWAASDYEKRIKYMRAIGGELSRLVSRIDGIRWGKVHVTIPEEKIFASLYEKNKTSASVTVELEPGRILSHDQVASIISLVSGYVPSIEPSHISIIDTKSRLYSSAASDDDSGMLGGGRDWAARSDAINSSIERKIQSYLDGVVGAGKSKVAVSTKLAMDKFTQNKTTFFPGAIGTHEYSEEALGNAASNPTFTGMESFPQPKPVEDNTFYQSQDNEMVDPRLKKDMPGNMSMQEASPNATPMASKPDPSKPEASPYDTGGLYDMGKGPMMANDQMGAQAMNTNPNDPSRFVCAAGDEVCKRNYRRHNFSIHSYPSYEQTVKETPPGSILGIKISVVVEKGSLPVSIGDLKNGIAAAADPTIGPDNVEVILRPSVQEVEEQKQKNNFFGLPLNTPNNSFQWWWIPVGLFAIFLFFAIIGQIGSFIRSLTTNNRPKNFREEPLFPPPARNNPAPSPLDRIDLNYGRPQTAPPQSPLTQNTPAPANDFSFGNPPPKATTEDLPFDLDDEFALDPGPTSSAPQQPNVVAPRRTPRERPKVIIEDDI